MKNKLIISGEYNRDGYTIFAEDIPVYSAGNNPLESSPSSSLEGNSALPLATLRKFCRSTANEIAREKNGKVGSITHVSEEE